MSHCFKFHFTVHLVTTEESKKYGTLLSKILMGEMLVATNGFKGTLGNVFR